SAARHVTWLRTPLATHAACRSAPAEPDSAQAVHILMACSSRATPPIFDLAQLRHMFWDGRVETDGHGHFITPAGSQLTPAMQRVLQFGAVSAQPMFPVAARAEMRGQSGNELTGISDNDYADIWSGLMRRLGKIPQYRRMFEQAYPGKRFDDMNFAYASNAIAGFLVSKFTMNN